MTAPRSIFAGLSRPKLLVSAARFGLSDYDRGRDLTRLLRLPTVPSPHIAVDMLAEREADLEESRRAGAAGYSPTRHVEILTALLAESRLLPPDVEPE